MRHLAPLAAVYLIAAAFLAPAAPAVQPASDDQFTPETPPAAPAPAAPAPVAPERPTPTAAKADAPTVTGRQERVSLVRAAASGAVTIRDFSFGPATISVNAGDTVTWRNDGKTDHTATGQSFDTGVLSPGGSGSFTFKDAGTFAYVCSIHANMKGTVKVAAADSGGQSGGGSNGSTSGGTTGSGSTGGGSTGGGSTGSAPSGSGGAALPKTGGEELRLAGFGALLLVLGAAGQAGLARRRGAR